jgi:hypothetical protein
MRNVTRRDFLATTSALAAGLLSPSHAAAQEPGERPPKPEGVDVLNPRGRVPVGLIIDDSTCLVNLAHFCIPQFAEVFPDRYTQPWKTLPREIPDAFVRKFGEWCHEHGVKGKYSVIPYPACVGWLDRDLPGWSKQELRASLDLVRTLMAPDWDLHPELMTHTWAINTKTGRPFDERSERFMENWGWSIGKSADELSDYFGFALRVLKGAGIDCTGITTPGGFGGRSRPALARATLEACRGVCGTEIPHYFRDLYTDDRSVAPLVQDASGLGGPDPRCVVSIIGCTGDWFGGWDGLERGDVNKIITEDGRGGRMPQVIARGEPAIMVCHWPGIYFNGEEVGFAIFKEAVRRLEAHYSESLIWMKPGEVARYWAARELTRIDRRPGRVELDAPFACPGFTIRTVASPEAAPRLEAKGATVPLREVKRPAQLEPGTWLRVGEGAALCIDLPKGRSAVLV